MGLDGIQLCLQACRGGKHTAQLAGHHLCQLDSSATSRAARHQGSICTDLHGELHVSQHLSCSLAQRSAPCLELLQLMILGVVDQDDLRPTVSRLGTQGHQAKQRFSCRWLASHVVEGAADGVLVAEIAVLVVQLGCQTS